MANSQLSNKVKRYINHKVILSRKSDWYSGPVVKLSLEHAYYLLKTFCKDTAYLTDKQIAIMVLQNKKHLFNILPNQNNRSYQSSLTNYTELITQSEMLLTTAAPK